MKHANFVQSLLIFVVLIPPAMAQRFGPWSTPVNIGAPVNTVAPDYQPFITKDNLSLYFVRIQGSVLPQDIWVAKRNSESEDWGTPEILGPEINVTRQAAQPFVTIDGHFLLFNANRPEGFGRADIYVSQRQNKREDFGPMGWQEPVNLGSGVNTPKIEKSPWIFADDATGNTYLYFGSDRAGSLDIYVSTLQPDGTFGPAVPVPELNTPFTEDHPSLSRDGLEIYFTSNRPGPNPYPANGCCGPAGQPSEDIWVSTRASTSDPWGPPVNLDVFNAGLGGPAINSPFHDGRPALSFDGTTLYFFSAFREGNQSAFFDIWKTTREKLTGPEQN